jgi:hypothetical protein
MSPRMSHVGASFMWPVVMVVAIGISVGTTARAAQSCFYHSKQFSEGAKLSVSCVTTKGRPNTCTVIVCTAGTWIKRDQVQCNRDGCPPRAPQ